MVVTTCLDVHVACTDYRARCAGRVLAHATTNTNTTRKQRHRAASPVAVRSPIQARITPRGARRDAYSPPMPPVFLHHQPPPSPCWQRRRLQLFCQRLRKGRQRSVERRRRSASLTSVRRALSCPALAAAAARCAVGGLLCTDRRCTAPPCASRGGRAAREGAVSRAICSACHGARAWVGALVHWHMECGGVGRWQNTSLARSHWARARPPSPRPFHPHSGAPPDRAAAAQSHFCHTLRVRRWPGASPQRDGRLVARSTAAAWRNHHVAIGGSCTAREQRWNGLITPPRP